jgi:D-arabinose 1-dehydrogenase-like Zn-dependent alcohol dehydrogenase
MYHYSKQACNLLGCFSKIVRIEGKFAFRIPPSISIEQAAPLMCAGITVWEPICEYVHPGSKVGVRSLGGLGHCAVQLSNAVGAEVFAFSRSQAKEEKIRELGASHFALTSDEKQMQEMAGTLDVIIDTCPFAGGDQPVDLAPWMNLLSFGGTYCKIGIPVASFKYDFVPLIFAQKKIVGSMVCGSSRTNEMLSVASAHNIQCDVEVIPFSKINEAVALLQAGKNSKSRIVLKW